ncbi:MAG: ArsR family transcriptional regulator [Rhodococcus sp.]|nr:ArsR family transcriptional regulator [Rhodococcus sp. (in: high G+C Gram-positive bacteria)]
MKDSSPISPHPALGLNDVVHQRSRLGILTLLRSGEPLEFCGLRDRLNLTDGNLNRHLKVLIEAGLATSERMGPGRLRTWITITAKGGEALDTELTALRAIIATVEQCPAQLNSCTGHD